MKTLLVSVLLAAPIFAADDTADVKKRIHESGVVLSEIMSAGDKGIPEDLLGRAQCVGIVPNLKRVGFIAGVKYGKGVITCRTENNAGWSGPSTIIIEGGSIGFQIGLGETDLVFVVMNRSGMANLDKDKFTGWPGGTFDRSAHGRHDARRDSQLVAIARLVCGHLA